MYQRKYGLKEEAHLKNGSSPESGWIFLRRPSPVKGALRPNQFAPTKCNHKTQKAFLILAPHKVETNSPRTVSYILRNKFRSDEGQVRHFDFAADLFRFVL